MAERGWLTDLLLVLVEPGTGLKLVPYINGSLLMLVLVLCATMLGGFFSGHLLVLLALAIALMASVNWFVHEYRKTIAGAEEPPGDTARMKRD